MRRDIAKVIMEKITARLQRLAEEGESAPTNAPANVTGGVEKVEKPLNKKIIKRKKLEGGAIGCAE